MQKRSTHTKKTGLFFGSFSPIHIGHMAVANYMAVCTDLEELWFVVSPQNPLKPSNQLWEEAFRLDLVKKAVEGIPFFAVCDLEFSLPRPSYTINTLNALSEQYPDRTFVLVMGSDGLAQFSQWKSADQIVSRYSRYIYPRYDSEPTGLASGAMMIPNATVVQAPRIEISSTFIRESLALQRDVRCFVPESIWPLLRERY
ncbi:MAG: nicotinate (nicotinamide) nucleotide adenylyltransferase [Bacteroidales bacterium]